VDRTEAPCAGRLCCLAVTLLWLAHRELAGAPRFPMCDALPTCRVRAHKAADLID
jgi:hypothetical protein